MNIHDNKNDHDWFVVQHDTTVSQLDEPPHVVATPDSPHEVMTPESPHVVITPNRHAISANRVHYPWLNWFGWKLFTWKFPKLALKILLWRCGSVLTFSRFETIILLTGVIALIVSRPMVPNHKRFSDINQKL